MDRRITPDLIKMALRRSSVGPASSLCIDDRSHIGTGLTVRVEGVFDFHTMAAVLRGDLPPGEGRGE